MKFWRLTALAGGLCVQCTVVIKSLVGQFTQGSRLAAQDVHGSSTLDLRDPIHPIIVFIFQEVPHLLSYLRQIRNVSHEFSWPYHCTEIPYISKVLP
jgi:hypothetical protein